MTCDLETVIAVLALLPWVLSGWAEGSAEPLFPDPRQGSNTIGDSRRYGSWQLTGAALDLQRAQERRWKESWAYRLTSFLAKESDS